MKMCDIIIYDIISDPTQVDEASWAVSGWFLIFMSIACECFILP